MFVFRRLLLLADLSCDVNGSMEFLERSTTIERPYFHYDPLLERETYDGVNSHNNSGIVVLGVDILPTELPRESSDHFGKKVIQVVRELIEGYQASTQSALDISHLRPGLVSLFVCIMDFLLEFNHDISAYVLHTLIRLMVSLPRRRERLLKRIAI